MHNGSRGVMQLSDSLDAGGMERVAVNVANYLPRDHYSSYLCTTRHDGPLANLIAPHVGRLRLNRNYRFDPVSLHTLTSFIRHNRIQILHAHGTSVFLAVLASLFKPHPLVVWHDHFGRYGLEERPVPIHRLMAKRLSGVIAVNQSLADWSRSSLRVPSRKVWYIRNFVPEPHVQGPAWSLPGSAGSRIVSVANLRPQKDQITLLKAMHLVVRQHPSAFLLIVGNANDPEYQRQIQNEIARNGLRNHVALLGPRDDVPAVLAGCDIGVLSSVSEGLPLSLIEYGMAGLPTVATKVGECEEVLDGGRVGLLVPPSSPEPLAQAISSLLSSAERRITLGKLFSIQVRTLYSMEGAMKQICEIYETIMSTATHRGHDDQT